MMWLLTMVGLMSWSNPAPTGRPRPAEVTVLLTDAGPGPDARPTVRFEVINHSPRWLRFCVWKTPLEGFTADMLEVLGPDGQPRPYLGPSVKRVAPDADDYAAVPGGATLGATFGPAEAYDLSVKGLYLLRFRGGARLNGLPDSAPLTLEVR